MNIKSWSFLLAFLVGLQYPLCFPWECNRISVTSRGSFGSLVHPSRWRGVMWETRRSKCEVGDMVHRVWLARNGNNDHATAVCFLVLIVGWPVTRAELGCNSWSSQVQLNVVEFQEERGRNLRAPAKNFTVSISKIQGSFQFLLGRGCIWQTW